MSILTHRLIYFILVIALPVTLFMSCEGPVGPDGAHGPAGAEGPVGPAGEDGSTIHAGEGTPDNNLGEIGDYYLDLDSGILYGPKNDDNGWGEGLNLVGQEGPAGRDGNQIYAGTEDPDESFGEIGDFYLNTDTYYLFGPKTEDGWGSAINLQGPMGPVGPAGEDGATIHAGEGAPDEELGVVGDYYLDLLSGDLYGPKTEDGWGDSISLIGPEGQQGEPGEDGTRIYSGSQPPDNSIGNPGDFYLNTDTYDLYGPKTASGWGSPINLQGPEGPAGQDGNANVVVATAEILGSDWNTTSRLFHYDGSNYAHTVLYVDLNISHITSNFEELGMVNVYFRNYNRWQVLPFHFQVFNPRYNHHIDFTYTDSVVRLIYYFSRTDGDEVPPSINDVELIDREFKIVLTEASTVETLSANNIDVDDYDALMNFLDQSDQLNKEVVIQ
jgi:hypothetical protein